MNTPDPSSTPGLRPSAGRLAAGAAGVVLALVLVLAFLSTWGAWRAGKLDLLPSREPADWLDGRAFAEIAEQLPDTTLPERFALATRMLAWRTLGDLGPEVRAGCSPWLFLAEELTLTPERPLWRQRQLDYVASVAARLRGQGTDLLVVVVPDKSRIVATELCAVYRPTELAGRITGWLAGLQGAGVAGQDLTAALASDPQHHYLTSDTHWTVAGAQAAAAAVAGHVRRQPAWNAAIAPDASWQATEPLREESLGDLIRLAGLEGAPVGWRPAYDRIQLPTFHKEAGAQASAADLLLGDAGAIPVALVGTSFSRIAGFSDWLAMALRTDIGSFAKSGGGFAGGMQDFMANPAAQAALKLVIWEIPERDLDRPFQVGARQAAP